MHKSAAFGMCVVCALAAGWTVALGVMVRKVGAVSARDRQARLAERSCAKEELPKMLPAFERMSQGGGTRLLVALAMAAGNAERMLK